MSTIISLSGTRNAASVENRHVTGSLGQAGHAGQEVFALSGQIESHDSDLKIIDRNTSLAAREGEQAAAPFSISAFENAPVALGPKSPGVSPETLGNLSNLAGPFPPGGTGRIPGGGASPSGTSFPIPLPYPAAGVLPRRLLAAQPGGATNPCASRPSIRQPIRGVGRFNFGDMRCRWRSFPPRVQACKQAPGSFRKCFYWFLRLFVHDEQSSMERTGLCPEIFSTRSVK